MVLLLAPRQMLHAAHRGDAARQIGADGDWLVDEKMVQAAPNTIFRIAQIGGAPSSPSPLRGGPGWGFWRCSVLTWLWRLLIGPNPHPHSLPARGREAMEPRPPLNRLQERAGPRARIAYKDIFISEGAMVGLNEIVGVLKAAGESTRLRLLALLADG